jgi:hypothetical protein
MPNLCLFCPHCEKPLEEFRRRGLLADPHSRPGLGPRHFLAALGALGLGLIVVLMFTAPVVAVGMVMIAFFSGILLFPLVLVISLVRADRRPSLQSPYEVLLLILSSAGISLLIELAVFSAGFCLCRAFFPFG